MGGVPTFDMGREVASSEVSNRCPEVVVPSLSENVPVIKALSVVTDS